MHTEVVSTSLCIVFPRKYKFSKKVNHEKTQQTVYNDLAKPLKSQQPLNCIKDIQ